MTSQYVPAGRLGAERAVSADPLRLNGDVRRRAAAERDLVAAVAPPVRHAGAGRGVAEGDHVRRRAHPVLALPPAPAGDLVRRPFEDAGGPASGSLKVKLDITCGTP
jgi:hypothetical protein